MMAYNRKRDKYHVFYVAYFIVKKYNFKNNFWWDWLALLLTNGKIEKIKKSDKIV